MTKLARTPVRAQVPKAALVSSFNPFNFLSEKQRSSTTDISALFKLMHSYLSKLCFALDVSVQLEMLDGTLLPVNDPLYSDWSS